MTRAAPPLRRYWTGWTDQQAPRAAPNVWPMPYHQSIATIDRFEAHGRRGLGNLRAKQAASKNL